MPKVISNTKLLKATGQKPIILQIKMRKWRLISHTLKGNKSIKTHALDWNLRGTRKKEVRSKHTKGPF
jgi:hypothetical protein